MKIKRKPIGAEAWRWDCGEPKPQWIIDAVRDELLIFADDKCDSGSLNYYDEIDFNKEHWLINDYGVIHHMDDTSFFESYERV